MHMIGHHHVFPEAVTSAIEMTQSVLCQFADILPGQHAGSLAFVEPLLQSRGETLLIVAAGLVVVRFRVQAEP